jgi:acetyl esterase/lipase
MKMGFYRFAIRLAQKAVRKPKRPHGKEVVLATDAGPVRVLGYNLDRPETLPLFVDMHGGGFTLGHAGDLQAVRGLPLARSES